MLGEFYMERQMLLKIESVQKFCLQNKIKISERIKRKAQEQNLNIPQDIKSRMCQNGELDRQKKFKCKHCGKQFSDGRQLGGHISRAHKNINIDIQNESHKVDDQLQLEDEQNLNRNSEYQRSRKKSYKRRDNSRNQGAIVHSRYPKRGNHHQVQRNHPFNSIRDSTDNRVEQDEIFDQDVPSNKVRIPSSSQQNLIEAKEKADQIVRQRRSKLKVKKQELE